MSLFKKIFTDDLLMEAQDYSQMFNDIWRLWEMFLQTDAGIEMLRTNPDASTQMHQWNKRAIDADIKWAKLHLKKNDRIVWFLRYSKIALLSTMENATGLDQAAEYIKGRILPPFISKTNEYVIQHYSHGLASDEIQRLRMITHRDLDDIKNRMEHFLSLPIAGIQNMIFGMNHWSMLINDMRKLENEWIESRKGMLDHDESNIKEVVLKFDDGFVWVDLGRGACSKEGNAMGHCGNVPSVKSGDTILSLRQISKDGNRAIWKPCLTFILHKGGILGEMKGRANEKPAEKYHPYIIELLKLDIIQGIEGGGYAPERNFKMTDLSSEEASELVTLKPQLADDGMVLKMFVEGTGDEKVVKHRTEQILMKYFSEEVEYFQSSEEHVYAKNGDLMLGWFSEAASLGEFMYKHNFRWHRSGLREYMEAVENNSLEVNWPNYKIEPYTWDHFLVHTNEIVKLFTSYCETTYGDTDEWAELKEDTDIDSLDVLARFLHDMDDSSFENLIKRCYVGALEAGETKEIMKELKSYLKKDLSVTMGPISIDLTIWPVSYKKEMSEWYLDDNMYISVSLDKLKHNLQRGGNLDEFIDHLSGYYGGDALVCDVDEFEYNSHDELDYATGREYFKDNFYDLGND